MNETESISNTKTAEPQNRTTSALVLFLLFILPMPVCLSIYHYLVWTFEQAAIASLSLKSFSWSGMVGLAVQGVFTSIMLALLWYFTKDDRFKPVYKSLLGASLMAFPALLLRLLGPNNDQVGSMLQFVLCLVGLGVFLFLKRGTLEWDRESLPFGLLIAGIGVIPFVIYGSFGSFGDAFLSLLASIALGLLAAVLMESTTGNIFLDGVGIGAVLALLGSVIGYDGAQLLLLAILPSFAFAIAVVMPSRMAAAAAVSLLAFAGLALFDPTELTIVLADVGAVALKAGAIVIVVGLLTSVAALVLHSAAGAGSGQKMKRAVSWAGTSLTWSIVVVIFFLFGNPGNYSDRLFVILKDQADISYVAKIENREERVNKAYEVLTTQAEQSQADLRAFFDKTGVEYTPYYLENAMEVRGGTLLRLYLLTRPEVDRVLPSPHLRAVPEDSPSLGTEPAPSGDVQWNISMIGADKVWDEFNVHGEGIVIGQSDTGVDGSHPMISEQYRGFGLTDDYNWYDPWDGTPSPHDEIGHGTHTMGTMLGKDGIGVAPEAKWIACVNLARNLANAAYYLDCMQFNFAPFPQGGDPFKDGDPTKGANVLNNSWGCPTLEGCDPNVLKVAADHLRDAGVFVVVSTGNDGPVCETVESPLSLYDSVFSVGAVDQNGDIANFSSRGPVTADGSGRIKPDIIAPGVAILSSTPENTYASFPGTSMAGPHVVGTVALIWSARPDLIGNIDATEQLIIDTAKPYTGVEATACGTGTPNNVYGYGLVDAYAAVKQALGK
jgi:subtilisin family serine protease